MPKDKVRIALPESITVQVTIPKGTILKIDTETLLEALTEIQPVDVEPKPPAPPPPRPPAPPPGPPAPPPPDPPPPVDPEVDPVPLGMVPWLVDVNPIRPFGKPQGKIPAGNGEKSGRPNRVAAQCEAMRDDSGDDGKIAQIRLWEPSARVQADRVEHTPGDAWVERVPDPAGSGAIVYRHNLTKQAVNFTPGGPDSFRAEVGGTGDDRYSPWGREEICVGAVYLPDYWADPAIEAGGEWAVVFQWHDAPGGLTHNPPFGVYLRTAGSEAKFLAALRKYKVGLKPPEAGNQVVASETFPAATGKWHHLVAHYRTDFTGEAGGFFKFYRAEGSGPLEKLLDYQGPWGSPNPAADNKPGFWKTGLYCMSKFAGRDDRSVFTRGFRQYPVIDGLTPEKALSDFLASR